MFDMQKLVDAMGAAGQQARKHYHLSLGSLISLLEAAPSDCEVIADDGSYPGDFASYRGYYSDLSLEPSTLQVTAGTLLQAAKKALGKEFTGYKGGEYLMDASTPLWFAGYGCCGKAITGAEIRDDKLTLITREVD